MTISDINILARVNLSADECRFLAEILEGSDSADEAMSERIFTMASLFRATAALTEIHNNLMPGEAEDALRSALRKSGLSQRDQAVAG